MSRFDSAWLAAHQAKRQKEEPTPKVGVDRERDLHDQILAECRNRQWVCFHGSMAHRTHRSVGEPDFVVLADNGRVLLVEAKTRTGKLSTEQQALHAWARKLGHEVHVVRSLACFLAIAG